MEDIKTQVPGSIVEQMKPLLNHIVIVHDSRMGRLVGIHRDAMDLYYHIRFRDEEAAGNGGRRDLYATCVGACVSLAGVERYEHIEADFTRNGCPPVDEFIESHATRAENLAMYGMSMVDDRHPSCDRITVNEDDPVNSTWWVLLRDMDGMLDYVEENDAISTRRLELPEGSSWADLLAERIRDKGGDEGKVLLAAERAAAPCCADERDHPGCYDRDTRRAEMEHYGRQEEQSR